MNSGEPIHILNQDQHVELIRDWFQFSKVKLISSQVENFFNVMYKAV